MSGPGRLFRRPGQAGHRACDRATQQDRRQRLQARDSIRRFGLQPVAGDASRQAAAGTVQASHRDRRGMLGRDARRDAVDGAGEGSAAQRRIVVDQDHRSGQSVDVPHHAERGDAGRGYRHQCLQASQRTHGGAALREHQRRHRQRQGVRRNVQVARRANPGRHRLRPRRERFHRDRDAHRGSRQGGRHPDLHAGRPGAAHHAGAGAGRRHQGRRRTVHPARHHLAAVRVRAEGRQGRARLYPHRAIRPHRQARGRAELRQRASRRSTTRIRPTSTRMPTTRSW